MNVFETSEPPSWQISRRYDDLEIYGSRRHLGYSYAYAARRRRTLAAIEAVAPPGARVLDVAAAQGNFSIALAERGFRVTWNDIRSELIPYVERKAGPHRLEYWPGNILEIERDTTFDAALVAEVIEHVAHPDAFLRQIADRVRPGGAIVLSTPNGRYFRNRLPRFSDCRDFTEAEARQFGPDADDHIFLLHPDELEAIAAAAGLQVITLTFCINTLTGGSLRSEALLRVVPRSIVERLEEATTRLPNALRERVHMGTVATLHKPDR